MTKRILIAASLLAASFTATAQPQQQSHEQYSYNNRKIISIGYTRLGCGTTALNDALSKAGYPVLYPSVGAFTINICSSFAKSWGLYYGADIGKNGTPDATGGKTARYQLLRFYAGAEYVAYTKDRFSLQARLALSYTYTTLRLYDTLADTTSFTQYIGGRDDAKRIQAGMLGIDGSFAARLRVTSNLFVGFDGGYVLSVGNNGWKHDAGSFDAGPSAPAATWYAGAKIGYIFNRRITRLLPDAALEPASGKWLYN